MSKWGEPKYFRTDPRYAEQKAKERKRWEKKELPNGPNTFTEFKNEMFWGVFAPGGIFGPPKKVPVPKASVSFVKAFKPSSTDASTSSTFTSKQLTSWGEEKELRTEDRNQVFGKWYDKMVPMPTPVSFKVNGQQVVKIEQFRSVLLPDKITQGESFTLQLACCNPNGRKTAASDPVYFTVKYNDSGKLMKMLVPNTPTSSTDPNLPVLTVHHGKVCILPVSSGTYNWLAGKVLENQGEVEIVGNELYTLECLSIDI